MFLLNKIQDPELLLTQERYQMGLDSAPFLNNLDLTLGVMVI